MADVFRVANYLARDRETAEDLTQETFAQALKSFHRYTPDTNCRAWLVTILYHLNSKASAQSRAIKTRRRYRRANRRNRRFRAADTGRIKDEEILQALEKLPKAFRDVVVLTDVEEFSYKEVAEFMQVPIGTVMSRLHRGRKLLRQQLTECARNFGLAADG
jgi:RNA polymerase sigma-70 factor (ECF subfamily)